MLLKVEPIAGGCLRVWLTEADMEEWGLSAHGQERRIRRLVRQVAMAAGWEEHSRLLAEMIEVEGGCLLLITPQEEPRQPIVYALAQDDHLLDLALRWRQVAEDPPYIALYTAPMGYRLAVYADTPLSEAYRRLLDEYGCAVGHGHGTVAHCGEYGEWLDAAALFTAPVPPQPVHGDPPH